MSEIVKEGSVYNYRRKIIDERDLGLGKVAHISVADP